MLYCNKFSANNLRLTVHPNKYDLYLERDDIFTD